MGHWAKLDATNHVVQVVVADDDKHEWLVSNFGGPWVQTSYNTYGGVHYDSESGNPSVDQTKALRKNYAAVGFFYDEVRDAFIAPIPFPSWILNEETCIWEPPFPAPESGDYKWNENLKNWVPVES